MIKINWNEFEEHVEMLLNKIDYDPDLVMCIWSGGLLLGKLVSERLKKPLAIISAKSYNGKEKGSVIVGNISSTEVIAGKVLLVDDLADSGETFWNVLDRLKVFEDIKEVKTATLFYKNKSNHIPDYHVKEVNDWVVFPYESE